MPKLLIVLPIALSWTALAADFAPALQWYKVTGGSGNSTVTSAAADPKGNFYIVGSTTSVDFPVTTAAQAAAGGSSLVRINLSTGSATRLYPANLPPISAAAASSSASPGTIYTSNGNQIWKSTDAGSTWALVSQFPTGTSAFTMAVDPTNSSIVYVGTQTLGAFKSVDGGVTFNAINNGIAPNPNGTINVRGIWVDPASPNVIFANCGSGIARSADGGNSWTIVTSNYADEGIAFDASPGTLYAAFLSSIFKSTDGGLTFTTAASPFTSSNNTTFMLATDPHHAGVLYAATTNGIYMSSDGAATWTLKVPGVALLVVADPNSSAFYATVSPPQQSAYKLVKSTDGFTTTTPVGPNEPSVEALLVSGPNLFAISPPSTDVFAIKLDPNGNVVYSTYFGGSGNDTAAAMAVGSDGSLYVTGGTTSPDLPVTPGAYLTRIGTANSVPGSYVFKLNPDGSLGWATYFTDAASSPASIALDAQGNVYVGGNSRGGTLPTTPGAYQTTFTQSSFCTGFIGCFSGPTAAFVTKFNPKGTGLIYSTYIANDPQKNTAQSAQALTVDSAGNAWLGVAVNPNVLPSGGPNIAVLELNSTGSNVVASIAPSGLGGVAAIALDANSNVYVAGAFGGSGAFAATPGAFQPASQPAIPNLPGGYSFNASDAFIAKFDPGLTHIMAATLFGGETTDAAASIAIDSSGTVIVSGYSDSKTMPLHAPFQTSFSSRSGFVAGFDSNLSNLLFSTYLGDGRPFMAAAAVPDGSGNILLAGSTLAAGGTFIAGDSGAGYMMGNLVVVNKISLPAAPAVRLDTVQNYASHFATGLAPGEPVTALGAGFGSGARIVLDGTPLPTISATATSVVAVVPDSASTSGAHTVQVSSGGALSNSIYTPAVAAAPAIYSVDGSGTGQGYILNSDGSLNSPTNPAAAGSKITIFAAGQGQYSTTNGYAITSETPAVFLDGFYCNGIGATVGPVNGLPGNVYQLSVYVPDPATLANNNPNLKNFTYPAQVSIQLVMGPPNSSNFVNSQMVSQPGILINVH